MHTLRRLTWSLASRSQRNNFVQAFLKNRTRCKSTTVERPPNERLAQISIPTGILGQPTCHTHPHLIQRGQLTCGITQLEFLERRDNLMSRLVAEVENESANHIVVIPAACKQYMSEKIPYVFRQNSDFFYLTGCLEPSAVLVMFKPAQLATYRSIMFVNDKDSHAELWEGPRTGCSATIGLFAVNEALPVESFPEFMKKTTAAKPSVVWYQKQKPVNPELHANVCHVLGHSPNVSLGDPERAIHFMRLLKSPAEIELMKETCYVGSQAINMAMACTQPGISEHNINAILEFTCKQTGADQLAFPPVVAGGSRATHIHYVANNQLLAENEMLLVDSGCQRWLYNSDISRTWPVSGKFQPYHKILYELVLAVQKRLIRLLGEQRPPLDQLFDQMCRLLGTHLQQEGILPKNIDGNELVARAYRLCPHHVSHYLGLDVHDASLVRRNVPVQPGMIVTVEPGIYIRPDDKSIPEEFRGIGIRIEDDVLITEGDPMVLTDSCVKETDEIEAIVGKHTLAM